MTTHRRRFSLELLVGLMLASGVCVYLFSTHALWVKDTDRIARGMTKEQVIATFGGPPDVELVYMRRADWIAMDGRIMIQFSADGRVGYRQYNRTNFFVWQFQRLRERMGV